MDEMKTPRTHEARRLYNERLQRARAVYAHGSHLESDDPPLPDGWETAEAIERELTDLRDRETKHAAEVAGLLDTLTDIRTESLKREGELWKPLCHIHELANNALEEHDEALAQPERGEEPDGYCIECHRPLPKEPFFREIYEGNNAAFCSEQCADDYTDLDDLPPVGDGKGVGP